MASDKHHYFAGQDDEVSFIVENGMRAYVAELDGVGRAFRGNDRIIRCMDEGTPKGILHRVATGFNFGLKDSIAFAKRARATGVSWHKFCGGVKLHLAGEGLSAEQLTNAHVDSEAEEFAKELAAALGLPCVEEELSRPDDLHVARGIYYDGTGQFDQTIVDGLPFGFAISRAFEEAEKAMWQAEVACSIAFDEHHGFGKLFSSAKPFLLIAIGKDDDHARGLEEELRKVAKSLPVQMRECIKVDSFSMQS